MANPRLRSHSSRDIMKKFQLLPFLWGFCLIGTILTIAAYFLNIGRIGIDFRQRYNEAVCVTEGINPHDIWTGIVQSDIYAPYDGSTEES